MLTLNDPEPLHPYDTLKSIFNNMRNFIHLLTFRHNEILCAAVLCFVHDGVFWGCYPAMKVLPEYRPLNFYLNIHRSIIRRAIELRCTHIEFGRGECNYKSRLGSTPIKTQALVKEYSCQPGIVYKAFEKIESLAS